MRIATFNINNVNKRLSNLLEWLRTARPDVVCLQELKAAQSDFPQAALEKAGYGAVWRGQKSWNGVAILARDRVPVVTHVTLPGDAGDAQSRYIAAAVSGVLIASLYAPNGNPQPGPKFDYKLAWMKRLAAHARELYAADVPVVLAGDYNVVPTDRDIYATTSYAKNALLQPESRSLYQAILDQGWVDAIRAVHPDATIYTFWDYLRNRWQRDAGLRLDHLLLSAKAAARLIDAGVDRDVRGREGASDHAPAWAVLRDQAPRRLTPSRGAPRARLHAGPAGGRHSKARRALGCYDVRIPRARRRADASERTAGIGNDGLSFGPVPSLSGAEAPRRGGQARQAREPCARSPHRPRRDAWGIGRQGRADKKGLADEVRRGRQRPSACSSAPARARQRPGRQPRPR